jgi:hypothetical protein
MVPDEIMVEFDYERDFLHYEGNIKFKIGGFRISKSKIIIE